MRLYGAIGPRVDGDYFAQELASLDRGDFDMIHIRMNSPGGNVFQGMSIVSAILSMNTPVCVHIDGIAASKALARLTDMLRQVLVRRGKDEATMAKLMREETWFSAAEALDAGLCDEITSSARNEFMNLDPMQLVAAVDAEYQTNNQEQMEKINLSAEAIVALGSKSGQMDEAAVSAAIVAAVAAKDEEIASLKAAKETAEAEIARLRKEKEDAVAVEAVSFADALVKAGKIAADAKDAVIETFKANPENARKIFGSVPERTKLSSLAGTQGGDAGKYAAKSWDELDRAGLLAELKANHPDLYEKKYKEMAASLHICRG